MHIFTCREWCAITLDDWRNIADTNTIIYFMTAEAFHYYIPSLLIGVLYNYDFIDWGIDALLPYNATETQKGKWWFDYVSLFSKEQRTAVLWFIEHADRSASDYILDGNILEIARQILSEH